MDKTLDQTTLPTLTLLESRLLRIEHILYGSSGGSTTAVAQNAPVLERMADLEKRFTTLTSRIRVYGELLRIYKAHPDFFQPPAAAEPPSQLTADELRAIVLSAAPSFPATASALTAVQDAPVPDPGESAGLAALTSRARAVGAALQTAQMAEVADLRRRSEALLRAWYERRLLPTSDATAGLEARVGRIESRVRRKERERELESSI